MKSAADFDEHFISDTYVHDVWWQAKAALENLEGVLQTPLPENGGYIVYSGSEFFRPITTGLGYASNVKKLIQPHNADADSNEVKEIKEARRSFFDKIFKDVEFQELSNVQVRNALEHFDSRLDSLTNKEFKKKNKYRWALYNLAVSHAEAFEDFHEKYKIRAYVVSEKTFYHCEQKIDLSKLFEDLALVLKLTETTRDGRKRDDGSSLIKFDHT